MQADLEPMQGDLEPDKRNTWSLLMILSRPVVWTTQDQKSGFES